MTGVVVFAGAPRPRLAAALGTGGAARLRSLLVRRAAAWARSVAPGRALLVGAEAEGVETLAPDGGRVADQLAAAAAEAFGRFGGPVLIAGIDAPRLSPVHAEAALGDLADGAQASFGPGMAGGWYLAGLAEPYPEVFTADAAAWGGDQVMARTLGVAQRLGIEVGILRMERVLATPLDALALAIDPLVPSELRSLLGGVTNAQEELSKQWGSQRTAAGTDPPDR